MVWKDGVEITCDASAIYRIVGSCLRGLRTTGREIRAQAALDACETPTNHLGDAFSIPPTILPALSSDIDDLRMSQV